MKYFFIVKAVAEIFGEKAFEARLLFLGAFAARGRIFL